ncbi:MAG: hypothetical protein JRJ85_14525, partial [Deltaproteobacteria bacterium]|nr:hypothetical protein [Deltaproteobacteria bacterium]
MNTGIFFYYQQGERLRDFPQALDDVLGKDNVFLYDGHYPSKPASSFDLCPIPPDAIQKVHSEGMIRRVMETGAYEGALYSASGTFEAARRICAGELTNAFVFTGYGDHHAGSVFFGGGCYFNGAAIAIREMREKYGMTRFAIVDTDAHHGDGTWELFGNDPHVLYICFCGNASYEENNNVNIQVPEKINDHDYVKMARHVFEKCFTDHRPEMIFWNWGYDGTRGDYGDIGL